MASKDGFVVIGAGLPRTGTTSMHEALSTLLGGPCYHMRTLFNGTKEETDFWYKALDDYYNDTKILKDEDWVNFLEKRGYRAGVDFPISLFYKELMKAFPNAKVVLTVRDDGEGWYKSVKSTIFRVLSLNSKLHSSTFLRLVGTNHAAIVAEATGMKRPEGFKKGMFEVAGSSLEESVEFYNHWNEEVKRTVPADRLLVFNVKQGWKPLCDFLNLPEPKQPFPNVNDTKSMQRMFNTLDLMGIVVTYVIPCITAGLGYLFLNSKVNAAFA